MAMIRLEQAQPGMEIASDVVDRNSQLLAKAGTEISEKELRLFKMWGVTEIEIAGDEVPDDDSGGGASDLVIEPQHHAAARDLFRHCELDHPLMARLLEDCAIRIARRGNHGAKR